MHSRRTSSVIHGNFSGGFTEPCGFSNGRRTVHRLDKLEARPVVLSIRRQKTITGGRARRASYAAVCRCTYNPRRFIVACPLFYLVALFVFPANDLRTGTITVQWNVFIFSYLIKIFRTRTTGLIVNRPYYYRGETLYYRYESRRSGWPCTLLYTHCHGKTRRPCHSVVFLCRIAISTKGLNDEKRNREGNSPINTIGQISIHYAESPVVYRDGIYFYFCGFDFR